jgi:hypothetical protein
VRIQCRTLKSSRSVGFNNSTISSSAMLFSSTRDFRPGRTNSLCGFAHLPVQSQNSVHGRPCFAHDLHACVLHAPPARVPCGLHEHPGTLPLLLLLRSVSHNSAASTAAVFRAARCADRAAEPRCGS